MTTIEAEREAFEAKVRSINPAQLFLEKWDDGTYKQHEIQKFWIGWQWRSAITASAAEPISDAGAEEAISTGEYIDMPTDAEIISALHSCGIDTRLWTP